MGTEGERYAQDHCVYKVRTGSTLFGTNLEGKSDLDETGIFVHTLPSLFDVRSTKRLDNVVYRSAGEGNRSTDDDIDGTLLSLNHFMAQAARGNPNMIPLLYVPADMVLYREYMAGIADYLREEREKFLSKALGHKYLGYLFGHKRRYLEGEQASHTKRPEIVEEFGFDTKAAYHTARIAIQGIELMTDQTLTLPMKHPDRTLLKAVRMGNHSKVDVLSWIDQLTAKLETAVEASTLPEEPDYAKLTTLSIRLHQQYWVNQAQSGTSTN